MDVGLRDKRHEYEADIYGFQQITQISSREILMQFAASVDFRLLLYLRSRDIHHVFESELEILLRKYVKADINMHLNAKIEYLLSKEIKRNIINGIWATIFINVSKLVKADDIQQTFLIGSNMLGTHIFDIENLTISEIQDKTIDELIIGASSLMGLRLGIVRATRILDIENLTIAQIQNRTLQNLSFTVIV